jgi:hypothetical protein
VGDEAKRQRHLQFFSSKALALGNDLPKEGIPAQKAAAK